jgi:cupin superfamily acireductone dioxygenase involved in methionine salvage
MNFQIKKGKLEPFGEIDNHFDVNGIIRYSMIKSGDIDRPFHLAIHEVSDQFYENSADFTDLHSHDFDEINVIVSQKDELKYEFQIGNQNYFVEAPCSILIPSGTLHKAVPQSGNGIFICIQFN